MRIASVLNFHLRRYGHFRFKEPVLVFESDDWGKVAGRDDGVYPKECGNRTDWSHDRLENEEELDGLFGLLESFKNDFERAPAFTANFVVSNPDFEKTKSDNYSQIHLKPIDAAFPKLHAKWLEGVKRGIFMPQFHGRLHYNAEKYLSALQTDEKTRFLFEQGINGGMENFEPTRNALYSEYFRTDRSVRIAELQSWINLGLIDFERIFGLKSTSTIAPNYVIHPDDFTVLAQTGINFLQAGNKIQFAQNGQVRTHNYCQGYQHSETLTVLARNHKLEPNRGRKEWKAAFSIQAAKYWFDRNVPAVIDTHRFNYVSRFAEDSRKELQTFLQAMRGIKNLHILTTPELGEAIVNQGRYADVFTGQPKKLTPCDNWLRRKVRSTIE